MRKESASFKTALIRVCVTLFLTSFLMLVASYSSFSKEKSLRDFARFVKVLEHKLPFCTTFHLFEDQLRNYCFNIKLYQRIHVELTSNDQKTIGRPEAHYAKVQLK